MNARERFIKNMTFQPTDRPIYKPYPGCWNAAFLRWRSEGYEGTDNYWDFLISNPFGMDPSESVGIGYGMCPGFERVDVSEDETHITYVNHEGIKLREMKAGGELSMPEFLDFPVKTREDFQKILPRLQLNREQRFPKDWPEYCEKWKTREAPLLSIADRYGGFFGPLRNLMGLENLCMAYYDDPVLVEMMVETITELMLSILKEIFKHTDMDWFMFWEDMCYKNGPLLSPALFKRYMSPAYRRVTDFLRSNGVEIIFVDSDGKIDELIPLWLDAGVNGVFPLEVQCGADAVKYRNEYGKDLRMIGGVDKRSLAKDKQAIKDEVKRLTPVIEKGGYIAQVDHSIPPDVSYENFLYYLKLMKEVCGLA